MVFPIVRSLSPSPDSQGADEQVEVLSGPVRRSVGSGPRGCAACREGLLQRKASVLRPAEKAARASRCRNKSARP